ncbi:NF-X1-type zinc finger protein NFXL1 [Magnolia sinica]|uniref:NF-X1-type zinc finger protein NFXL1 n=1 Tax=Magnolia sinica TaxID=86752 RepID=UPI002659E5B1|nr:NF-X1-type zinc finger protein NFXL1 [Magnolia sinica]XP_058079588.1 NF-X1-type zinc finger protein NFXL1 [Magnolia sinica]XP_058079589.1 NF-X1-type zinc finger protein NFXL1 [Magnolia sinica]XP_058079590.1 NF-X1-type zinc finger protein NFXL1 [Magnolia sinica]XP_058079591.1 NF-X1-type zinc finger protein NFXL1 [Magnolia sinica]XP_058079592.1 NF-X1-type zinc finger protein NFXL1 [Magnolia sinica]XP_058079593.1 NF-X1-type zinc finger protein NFXL1 [Magnolia sinica]
MRPFHEVSQPRHDRRDGSRPSTRPGRQEWVRRGSATVVSSNSNLTIAEGREPSSRPNPNPSPIPNPNPNPDPVSSDGRLRPKGQYVVKKRETEVPESAAVPQLVQEIQDKLVKGAVECMICYDMVRRSAPIWSCSSCYSIFHLNCIKKWARAPTSSDLSAEKNQGLNWRCPGCQSVQLVSWKEIRYACFCGRRTDPPSDFYLTPHSCGEPCGKPLDRESMDSNDGVDENRCSHVCVLQCHPGPCPPCKAFAPPRRCPCGKKMITRRCSDKSILTCGQRCDKFLECMRHRCERMCHTGACDPCQVLINASCFCKKKTEIILCGEMSVKGEVNEVNGLFSCNSVCRKELSCRHHYCDEVCHPGPCGECDLLPSRIKTCHCGKTPLTRERQSCLDPIPTCSQVCGKVLHCGVHHCKNTCHEGQCAPCLVIVNQKCRCGSTSRAVECYKTVEERDKFFCEKPCGRKKNCGRHRCSERCCPLSSSSDLSGDWDPHLCSMACGKKLRCGQHSCESFCHSGHCPPCMETIFSDLSCACGKTVIPPPLPCGTPPPSCQHPCAVTQPCGHLSTHSCHFGDCPPCTVPVAKECVGGHVVLRSIPCGSKDIRCNQLCGKTRQCGMHACSKPCHPPPCDSSSGPVPASNSKVSCGQSCGAPRRDCRHTCAAPCHPSAPCPDLRCNFSVTITCSCGRITTTVPCDVGGGNTGSFHVDTVFEASVIQKLPVPLQPVEANGKKIPLGQRKLVCDEDCAKIERKRVLAEAFEITPPNLDALHFGDSSTVSESLADLLRREPKWVLAVEERFKFLVLGKSKGSTASGLRVHVFCAALKEKRDAIRHIAERWKLSVQAAGWEPKRFLVVHVTPKSRAPARILGPKGAVPIAVAQPPAFDPLVDMDPRLVVALLDLPRDADISALVLRFGGECELVWLNDRNALAVFGDPARAATALRRLDHGTAYHGAVVVLQNGSASGSSSANAWGGSKDGASMVKSSNPWKKAVVQELGWSEDSWGGDWSNSGSGADATAIAVVKAKEAPIAASKNRWNLLDPDSNPTGFSSVEASDSGHRTEVSSSASESKAHGSVLAVQAGDMGVVQQDHEEVEDWEEAYE